MDSHVATFREEQLSSLLDLLYSTDQHCWPQFLSQLVSLTGSRSGRMLVMDRQAKTVLSSIKHNIDDSAHRDYVAHYVNACPWRPELQLKQPGRLYSTYLDFSCRQDQFYQSEFFNDWAGPQDIHHGACGTVWQDSHYTVQLLIQRTGGQGHYDNQETTLVNQLVPHLQRAIRLKNQVAALEQKQQALSQATDQQACPFAIVDQRGQLVHLSSEAELLLLQQPAVQIQQGRLEFQQPRLQGQLSLLLAQVTGAGASLAERAGNLISIPASPTSLPLHCLVSPLPTELAASSMTQILQQGNRQSLAILYFYLPGLSVDINTALLAQLFSLSDAEARVAAGVALGHSPQQLAARHDTSVHTVRSQLKSVFQKTATARQNELASLILTSPAVHRRPAPLTLQQTG